MARDDAGMNCRTIQETAHYLRVSSAKVRAMIRSGMLAAIDTGRGTGRTQHRITPQALADLERRLAVPKAQPRRRRRIDDGISPEVRKFLGLDED
jgi:excisionase family DNA binding protein